MTPREAFLGAEQAEWDDRFSMVRRSMPLLRLYTCPCGWRSSSPAQAWRHRKCPEATTAGVHREILMLGPYPA